MVQNSFEGGVDQTTITVGNSGGASGDPFSVVNIGAGAIAVYSATTPLSGSTLSGEFATRATATDSWVSQAGLALSGGTTYGRVYIFYTDAPVGNNTRFLAARTSSNTLNVFTLEWNTANQIRILDGASSLQATAATSMSSRIDSWVRIEYETILSATVGKVTLRMYDEHDTTPFEEFATAATINTRGTMELARCGLALGNFANAPTSTGFVRVDNMVAGATDWVGPAVQPIKYTPQFPVVGNVW